MRFKKLASPIFGMLFVASLGLFAISIFGIMIYFGTIRQLNAFATDRIEGGSEEHKKKQPILYYVGKWMGWYEKGRPREEGSPARFARDLRKLFWGPIVIGFMGLILLILADLIRTLPCVKNKDP